MTLERDITGTITPSGTGSNSNKEILHTPLGSWTEASQLDAVYCVNDKFFFF